MNMTLEDRLRDAYQAAARTVQPGTIHPGVRYHSAPAARSHRRFTIFAPLAAAAAVIAVAATAVTVPHLVGGSGHRAPAALSSPVTTGADPFLLEVAGAPGGSKLAVQQAGTRHVMALLAAPHNAIWDAVSAAGGRTFIAAATTFHDGSYTSALYRLTLSAAGKLSQFTGVRSAIPGEISAVAGSRGGHQIAYVTLPGNTDQATVGVISGTGTGILHGTVPLTRGPGDTGLLPDSLALSGNGSELGFITLRVADTVGRVRAAGTVWLLPASSVPGSPLARSHKVTTGPSGTAPFSAVLAADGRTMYVLSMTAAVPDSAAASRAPTVTLSAYSTANGALLRTVHTWTGVSDRTLLDPGMTISGSQLLIWGVNGTTAYRVDTASGTTTPVWVYSLQDKNQTAASIAW